MVISGHVFHETNCDLDPSEMGLGIFFLGHLSLVDLVLWHVVASSIFGNIAVFVEE